MYEELIKRIRSCSYSDPNGCDECRDCPNADNFYECKQKLALQAADVRPVVLCRDCKNYIERSGACAYLVVGMREDDFCSYGKRREES